LETVQGNLQRCTDTKHHHHQQQQQKQLNDSIDVVQNSRNGYCINTASEYWGLAWHVTCSIIKPRADRVRYLAGVNLDLGVVITRRTCNHSCIVEIWFSSMGFMTQLSLKNKLNTDICAAQY